jgi:hypothetical protein
MSQCNRLVCLALVSCDLDMYHDHQPLLIILEQDIKNGVGLKFGDTEHATGNARVDTNALPASYWVDMNDRISLLFL